MMKHRAHAGYGYEPCQGCGQTPEHERKKGTLCPECTTILAAGKEAIARADQDRANEAAAVFTWCSTNYGWPMFYPFDCEFPHENVDLHRQLANALWNLVNVVSRPAPPGTPHHSPNYTLEPDRFVDGKQRRNYKPWPTLFARKGNSSDSWSWPQLQLVRPDYQVALNALYEAIGDALAGVYHHGKERGGRVLQALARGELTLDKFDDALLTSEDRAARERARRDY